MSNSRFAMNPAGVDIQRSRFTRDHSVKTTWNAGKLVPLEVAEVLPGDTIKIDLASVVRMSTPLHPVLDNCSMTIAAFFVPNRLVWNHWKEFCGENSQGHWTPSIEYQIPHISAPVGGFKKGSVADMMGIPTDVAGSFNALPLRGYGLIYNEWWRSEVLQDPVYVPLDDTDRVGSNDPDYMISAVLGGELLPVCKFPDYFTTMLPDPQKGNPVQISLLEGFVPVYALPTDTVGFNPVNNGVAPLRLYNTITSVGGVNELVSDRLYPIGLSTYDSAAFGGANPAAPMAGSVSSAAPLDGYISPANLFADMNNVNAGSVNQLRFAFAAQRAFERLARGGSRYTEILKSFYGVTSPDARLQRPEFLGGKTIPINMDTVLQNSASADNSPLGTTGAYSHTCDRSSLLSYSATEHGYLHIVMCCRHDNTYQYGIEKFWQQRDRFDVYYPVFANIGEQPVKRKTIYADGSSDDDLVFGYQEAWAEYRYAPNRVCGAFRSNYAQTLDSWHYADKYSSAPYLSADWIAADKAAIDRTLAVSSAVEDQFIGDFYFKSTWVRPMPMYSIPGLIDHY